VRCCTTDVCVVDLCNQTVNVKCLADCAVCINLRSYVCCVCVCVYAVLHLLSNYIIIVVDCVFFLVYCISNTVRVFSFV
jgi:hypothetical protein